MSAPPPPYAASDYWERRYAARTDEDIFEWYLPFEVLRPHLLRALPSTSLRILHVGSGNSALPEDMHTHGFTDQLANDISPSVIARMAERTAHRRGLRWSVEDALAMPHATGSWDAVVDKGTFDALSTSHQDRKLVAEVYRILRPGGIYALFSSLESTALAFGPPFWNGGEWQPIRSTCIANDGTECWLHCATKSGGAG